MSVLKIKIAPDKFLRSKSSDVADDEFGEELNSLVADMIETMNYNDGVGLSAIQVGISKRIIVANLDGNMTSMINPVILSTGDKESSFSEGCLSVPAVLEEITRPESIVVSYKNTDGSLSERSLSGINSHIVQHEIDHLNGITILDKIFF